MSWPLPLPGLHGAEARSRRPGTGLARAAVLGMQLQEEDLGRRRVRPPGHGAPTPAGSARTPPASRSPSTSRSNAGTAASRGGGSKRKSTGRRPLTATMWFAPASAPRRRKHRSGRGGRSVQEPREGGAGVPANHDRAAADQADLRPQRGPCPRPCLAAHAGALRRMAHEAAAGPGPVRRKRSRGRAGTTCLAGRAREAITLGPDQGGAQARPGRNGGAQLLHL